VSRIPEAFIDWHLAMSRETDWARHERDTLMVYGTADPIGSTAVWRRFTGRLLQGELEVVEGGGHLVWYDHPGRVGARVAQFLAS
jgi:pimeloyl-ACP methyl ester carboxylesterase